MLCAKLSTASCGHVRAHKPIKRRRIRGGAVAAIMNRSPQAIAHRAYNRRGGSFKRKYHLLGKSNREA